MKNSQATLHMLPYIIGCVFIVTSLSALPAVFSLLLDNDKLRLVCWMIAVAVAIKTSQWSVRWLGEEYEDFVSENESHH